MTTTMVRTWTSVGERIEADDGTILSQSDFERAIEQIEWRDVKGRWSMSHGLAIQKAIRELRIPKVTLAGISTARLGDTYYDLFGIEGHYANGRVRVYVVDRGTLLTPVASEIERVCRVCKHPHPGHERTCTLTAAEVAAEIANEGSQ